MAYIAGYELKEFDSASLTSSYQNLGSALSYPSYETVISNESNVGVYISIDGSTNTFRLSPGQILDIRNYTRHFSNTQAAYVFSKGTQLSIKQATAAGTGPIIVNVFLAR